MFTAQYKLKGDINGDDVVDKVDAAYYLRYLISDGLYDFADRQLLRADMNNDKKYDMLDVIKILQTAESNNT